MPPRLAIFTEDPGWHGARIRKALARRGCEGVYASLTQCRLALAEDPLPVAIPGFEARMPDAAFVRGVPGGSLEEVIFYLDVLHALTLLGIPVYNDAGAIERTVDKGMTSFRLHRGGIPTPPTWVVRDRAQAESIARAELDLGHEVVSKPLFGSQGEGLRRYSQPEQLGELSDSHGVFYLQRFIDSTPDARHDWRVFVIHNKAVAAMRRCGVTWLNNVAQGARCEPARLDDLLLCRLAEDAVRLLDMNYAGVDIIRDRQGRYSVLEV
ncbi:MAG: alpha-L-glutamate ligase, partial [Gammaproteobacteria bacterium]|nr:alpha-L-glutamate ligase [Gammaproteobacteria bacterium]